MLFHLREDLQVKLLYGAIEESELVYKDILLEKANSHSNLKVYFTVDKPSSNWPKGPQFGTGYMDANTLRRELPPPGDDLRIILCGPWKMCQVIKQLLPEIGYPPEQWYSFM
jgi:cytochrome-b5 reductase